MSQHINAETAHRVVAAIKQINFEKYDNIQGVMEQFRHIRLREGYVLDAFNDADFYGARYKLYARRIDADKELYYELVIDDIME